MTETESKSLPFQYRFVVGGDIHLKRTDALGKVNEQGLNTRLVDRLVAVRRICDYAAAESATHLIFLGDIFHALNPPERLKELFWEALEPAITANISIRIILGNHDSSGQAFNMAGDRLISKDSIHIFPRASETESLVLADRDTPLQIKYVPFTTAAFDKWDWSQKMPVDMLFGHIEIEGAQLAADNMRIRHGLDRKLFDNIRLVWLGHIHKAQTFRPGFGYLGSCVRCDFSEIDTPKMFGVVDVKADGRLSYNYIDIPQRPMYCVNVLETDADNLVISEKIPEELGVEGVLIKLVLTGTPEWIRTVNKSRLQAKFPKAMRVLVEESKLDSDRPKAAIVTSNMEERVHLYNEQKRKSKDCLRVGLEIAKLAEELEQ